MQNNFSSNGLIECADTLLVFRIVLIKISSESPYDSEEEPLSYVSNITLVVLWNVECSIRKKSLNECPRRKSF